MLATLVVNLSIWRVVAANEDHLGEVSLAIGSNQRVTAERLAGIENRMLSGTTDRYRGDDARRDLAIRDNRLSRIERRLADLVRRIDGLEWTITQAETRRRTERP